MGKIVYVPDSVFQADTLRELLHKEGIASSLENENQPQWQETSMTPPMAIHVAQSDADRATRIIQQYFDQRKEGPRGKFEADVLSRSKHRDLVYCLFLAAAFCFGLAIVNFIDRRMWIAFPAGAVGMLLILRSATLKT